MHLLPHFPIFIINRYRIPMKTLIPCILLIIMYPFQSPAQLQSITAQKLTINFDKTIHLIFPANIDYFDIGSGNVLATIADNVPFVLKIKANVENFQEETNISAITTDGKFYSFSISYDTIIEHETVLVNRDSILQQHFIPVCTNKSIHLIFPQDVIYSDIGNEQAITLQKTDANNIIKFIASEDSIPQTNLSVITSDKKFYGFVLNYNKNPEIFNYVIGPQNPLALIDNNEKVLTENSKEVSSQERYLFHLGINKNKMEFYCSGIYIKRDILYFRFGIKNTSNINFNPDFIKSYIRDIKQIKNTTIQETELVPLLKYGFPKIIKSNGQASFVLAYNKFTIPDKKKFEIEILDKDGGRHLKFRIENKSIIEAKKL